MPMSPGPHSAKEMPGTFRLASTFESARLFSIFSPSSNSPLGLSGQGSAMSRYSRTGDAPDLGRVRLPAAAAPPLVQPRRRPRRC